jgi:FkbM family methyltransferase
VISRIKTALREALARRLDVPAIPVALARLGRNGFTPELIFDVGAYHGHFAVAALNVWPAAKVACFEPLRHAGEKIEKVRRDFPGITLHSTLVGATEQTGVDMHVAQTSSSLLKDAHNADFPVETFPQTTLDATVRKAYAGRAPDLLKLDVQGFEMEVLKGCTASIGDIRVILTELSLLDLHENVPLLHEMVGWLAAHGFVAYDICGMTRRPLDEALWQADMVFVRRDDALRRDKGYFPGKSWIRT